MFTLALLDTHSGISARPFGFFKYFSPSLLFYRHHEEFQTGTFTGAKTLLGKISYFC